MVEWDTEMAMADGTIERQDDTGNDDGMMRGANDTKGDSGETKNL